MAYTGSASTRLAAVQDEINTILTSAQEYTTRTRNVRRARLKDLREIEKDLEQQVQEEANSGNMASAGRFVPPVT